MSSELILIVDDNKDVRAFVRTALEVEGYSVLEAAGGSEALVTFQANKISLIILDLSMGQPDGFEVCREIRRTSSVPIIMLTDRGEEMDEAMCLASGADDYITKPVSPRILALRVATQLRHAKSEGAKRVGTYNSNGLTLDLETRTLQIDQATLSITRTEFDFLKLLMEHPKRVFTREQVIQAIGGSTDFSSDHFLDTHASRLRLKIKNAGGPKVIVAVRGVGYRLIPAAGSQEEHEA
jgi:DNA-binding response OmpR family regulator